MKQLNLILAISQNNVIGNESAGKKPLPWQGMLPIDMKYFKETTIGNGNNAVMMGRVTKETIPAKWFPLSDRANIILTHNAEYELPAGAEKAHSVEEALEIFQASPYEILWVAGGGKVYNQLRDKASELHITRIMQDVEGEVKLEGFDPETLYQTGWKIASADEHPADEKNHYSITIEKWVRA